MGKQAKSEREFQLDIQEAVRHLTSHCLRAASLAHHIDMIPLPTWTTDSGLRLLGKELGAIAKELQGASEWETTLMDAWKALDQGARR